jgi:hypothetical protein
MNDVHIGLLEVHVASDRHNYFKTLTGSKHDSR